ncbi:MAG TPA: hypothetical protein VFT71_06460 [Candidatus Nitrosocosmicus sp.]|nr:hypothetical protein [Candidatus Nitrosocosmicus sp.]
MEDSINLAEWYISLLSKSAVSKAVIKKMLTESSNFHILLANSNPHKPGILKSVITNESLFCVSLKYSKTNKGLVKDTVSIPLASKYI